MFWTGEECWVFGLDGDWRGGLDGFLPSKSQRPPATSSPACLATVRKEDLAW